MQTLKITIPNDEALVAAIKTLLFYIYDLKFPTHSIYSEEQGQFIDVEKEPDEIFNSGTIFENVEKTLFEWLYLGSELRSDLQLESEDSADFLEICRLGEKYVTKDKYVGEERKENIFKVYDYFIKSTRVQV